jgi:hypothetical protein
VFVDVVKAAKATMRRSFFTSKVATVWQGQELARVTQTNRLFQIEQLVPFSCFTIELVRLHRMPGVTKLLPSKFKPQHAI